MGLTFGGSQVYAGGLVLFSGSFQSGRRDTEPPGARVTTHMYKVLGAQGRGGQWLHGEGFRVGQICPEREQEDI